MAAYNQQPLANAGALIDAVNALRAGNGQAAFNVHPALMSAAQAHADYQASIGSVTHEGAGGTRPRDRAIAWGYGSGQTVFVSENIAGGTTLTAAGAVEMWTGDAPHLNTMLGPNYRDAGAGVATANGFTYYVFLSGYVAGGQSAAVNTAAPTNAAPVGPIFSTGATATPQEDGSIVHIVQDGQTLWTIAAIYQVSLPDLYRLNNFNENTFIFPGDRVIVQAAPTPTATASPTATATVPQPTRTLRPTRTATPGATPSLTPTPPPLPEITEVYEPWRLGAIAGIIIVAGIVLLLLSRKPAS